MLKGLIQSRNTREEKDLQNQTPNNEENGNRNNNNKIFYNNGQTKSSPIKKMAIGTYISIITLNINGLNVPTKRYRLAEWIQKQDPYIFCLQETHFRRKGT